MLPPIIEKDEHPTAQLEDQPPVPEKEERALVLYKPVQLPLVESDAPTFSIKVNYDFLSGCKGGMSRPYDWNLVRNLEDDKSSSATDKWTRGMDIVPWVPSTNQHKAAGDMDNATTIPEKSFEDDMDVEGGLSMDVEQEEPSTTGYTPTVLLSLGTNHGCSGSSIAWDQKVPTANSVMWSS